MPSTKQKISFQGKAGAFSHSACLAASPELTPLACPTFADAFIAVEQGRAQKAMIPIDNSIAGRVADIHHLLPTSKLSITGEFFMPVHHCLLGAEGATLHTLKTVYSHVHALPQCRKIISELKLKPIAFEDTAGSAEKVAGMKDPTAAAIASALAADLYGLKILKKNIEDAEHNTTRFIILEKNAKQPKKRKGVQYLTSMIFTVRNMPAALYKALGGFATNGINITKLESYLEGKSFQAASFYAEMEGHPDDDSFRHAMEELQFYADSIRLMGTYTRHQWRSR